MIVKADSIHPINFGGLSIRDYTAKLESSSSFAVITVPPKGSHPEAWSKRSDKYYYVASGSVEFTIQAEVSVLSSGDFCLIPRGQHFSYRNTTGTPSILHHVHTPSFDLDSEVFGEKPKA